MNSTPPSARSTSSLVLIAVAPRCWPTRSARPASTTSGRDSSPRAANMRPSTRATVVLPVPGGPTKTKCRICGGAAVVGGAAGLGPAGPAPPRLDHVRARQQPEGGEYAAEHAGHRGLARARRSHEDEVPHLRRRGQPLLLAHAGDAQLGGYRPD